MKRIWFAIIFLSITISCCICEQIMVDNFHHELNKKITTAEKNPTADNIKDIKKYWSNKRIIMNALSDSTKLNDLNRAIIFLSTDDENIGASLADARAICDSYYEAQQISLSNIF